MVQALSVVYGETFVSGPHHLPKMGTPKWRSAKDFRSKRAMGFEPTTSSLGSWHSTAELRPRYRTKFTLPRCDGAGNSIREPIDQLSPPMSIQAISHEGGAACFGSRTRR